MTILTKEKLEEVASWAELSRSKNVTISAHVVGNIARRLLAAEAQLTALCKAPKEPDYTRYSCGCCGNEMLTDYDPKCCPQCGHNSLSVTPLYTAPPTPVVPAVSEAVNFITALQDCDELTENQRIIQRECFGPINTTGHGEQLRCRTEGIIFATNRMLAAWESGFIYCPATEILEIATIAMSAIYHLTNATDDDFKHDDKVLGVLREEIKKQQAIPTPGVTITFHNPQELSEALRQVAGLHEICVEMIADSVFKQQAAVRARQSGNTEQLPNSDEGNSNV
ncbi:FmdB family zinc ribbon protein [Dickeya fangzhongdai]|uniref:hypothetical protein n=1 Tax=Dickeya fangzhongdai TaxID=1778540 RepID=UPI002B2600BC|nr:hypothetical protein [Dickeya fangzhongdai]WOY03088.1 hypothetical protein OGM21_14510 [Dickeya fangzhongdai]